MPRCGQDSDGSIRGGDDGCFWWFWVWMVNHGFWRATCIVTITSSKDFVSTLVGSTRTRSVVLEISEHSKIFRLVSVR